MRTQDQMWHEFTSLPPIAQRGVLDFIAFLRARYAAERPSLARELPPLSEEPFISMWRDREEMTDSSQWLHQLRSNEWDNQVASPTIIDTDILIDARRRLDRAVLDACGWPHSLSDEKILERLVALNLERAGRSRQGF